MPAPDLLPARSGSLLGRWSPFGWSLVLCGAALSLNGCGEPLTSTPPPATPTVAAEPVSEPELRDRIDHVLELTRQRHMTAEVHAAWQVLHGILVYGHDLKIVDPQGRLVSAADYLLDGGVMQGWNLRPADHGVHVLLESGSKTGQGHKDQWIGYLSLSPCQLPLTAEVSVGGQQFTMADLINQAKWECRDGMEASWTLMALQAYEPLDSQWQAADGTTWTLERLVAMEAEQDLNQSACGGTHRLTGLTVAVNRYLSEHPDHAGPLPGGWGQAEEKINWAIEKAAQFQLPSGGFSSSYFARPGNSADAQTLIGTTGHTLEFLCYALPEEELRQPWVRRSVVFLCDLLDQTQNIDLECGALYHAAAGLAVYRQRLYGPYVPQEREVAGR